MKTTTTTTTTGIDWRKVDVGTWFAATIRGRNIIGQVTGEDGTIFLCQNELDGAEADDKLGFRYSWSIGIGNKRDLVDNDVTELKLLAKKPAGFIKNKFGKLIQIGGNYVEFYSGHIVVGCTTVPNSIVRAVAKKLIR